MIRFFLVLLGLSILIGAGTVYMYHQQWIPFLPSFFYPTLILLLFGTSVIYAFLYKTNQAFIIHFYLLTLVIKLIAYLVYNAIVVIKDKDGAFGNVAFFMVIYFLFTALEIAFLYHKISRQR